jgi:hypothetical protein
MRDLLGRYARDPEVGHEIAEELGGTGLVHVFDALSVDPAAGVKLSEGGFSEYMLCGAVAASVQAGPDRAVSEADRKSPVTAVAEAAGCEC